MASHDLVALLHLAGFITGVALYAMLAAMTLRRGARDAPADTGDGTRVPLAVAALGLLWNGGAFVIYGLRDFGMGRPAPVFVALSFAALGFLPAVVVHSSVAARGTRPVGRMLGAGAYALSAVAAILHFVQAFRTGEPSRSALLTLTIGYGAILATLVFLGARNLRDWRRSLVVVAVAAFAVSALHLSSDVGTSDFTRPDSWPSALLGHHASLLLVLVILYQDYRFAFADLFLRRALLLVVLVALAVTLHVFVAVPIFGPFEGVGRAGLLATSGHIALWVLTALSYPLVRRAVGYFVDRVVLERADYRELNARVAAEVETALSTDDVLQRAGAALAPALSARRVSWRMDEPAGQARDPLVSNFPEGARVRIPTADAPHPMLEVGDLRDGRRLLSDDVALLEAVAIAVARRIDVLRVTDERYARDRREREILQLATDAELRSLRSQLNPHFLFNALTTIGYLIQAAPPRALATLYRLTELLRAVLRRSSAEYVTLQEEIEIIEAYLAIERARFEERLQVTIDIPTELRTLRVPPLLLQPLVENAIKHGVSPLRRGGQVTITARVERVTGGAEPVPRLTLVVSDSGVGIDAQGDAWRRSSGVGLANIERRLARHFGDAATLRVTGAPGHGTTVAVSLPSVA